MGYVWTVRGSGVPEGNPRGQVRVLATAPSQTPLGIQKVTRKLISSRPYAHPSVLPVRKTSENLLDYKNLGPLEQACVAGKPPSERRKDQARWGARTARGEWDSLSLINQSLKQTINFFLNTVKSTHSTGEVWNNAKKSFTWK